MLVNLDGGVDTILRRRQQSDVERWLKGDRILAGDSEAIEAALCFVELRPYFFRSGYMFKALLPKLKRAPLSATEAARLQTVLSAYDAWREPKRRDKA